MAESLEEWLFQMDRRMQVSGMRPLTSQELQMLAKRYQANKRIAPQGEGGEFQNPVGTGLRRPGGLFPQVFRRQRNGLPLGFLDT